MISQIPAGSHDHKENVLTTVGLSPPEGMIVANISMPYQY